LVINVLNKEKRTRFERRYGIKKLEPGKNIHQQSSWQKFCNRGFLCETWDFVTAEDMIHSVAATVCSFNVSLGSTDLNQSCPWDSVF